MNMKTLVTAAAFATLTAAVYAVPPTTVENSTITNTNVNGVVNQAQDKSKINSGVEAVGATIKDATIENTNSNVKNTAISGSTINSGIQANGATISSGASLTNINKDLVNIAIDNSKVNSGIEANGATIKDGSIVYNEVKGGLNKATGGAIINGGVSLNNATVEGGSNISNTATNVINIADGQGSKINSGIQADGATIKNSTIVNVNNGTKNTAVGGSTVNSGINLGN